MKDRRTLALSALVTLLAAVGPLAAGAQAVIHTASVLDGPSNAILEVDGAAMAPDGTGGVLYRKQVQGISHLFVVPFRDGDWGTPMQVDTEDPYGASEPAIAAGDDGRLLVAWVQLRNVSSTNVPEYSLMSASLSPGASGFGQAIAIDTQVSEPYTGDISGVDPRLAMAPDGQAYAVYRVTLDDCALGDENNPQISKCSPGGSDKVVSVRTAHFEYLTWSSLGQMNRASQIEMRNPTTENAPSIGIALDGNGVVAWQEPEASGGAARIWVRRLFRTTKGEVLQASPATVGAHQVTSDASAPALGVGPFGEARVTFKILGGQGSAVATPQLFVNSMLSEIAPHGSELRGATAIAGAQGTSLGVPSAAVSSETGFYLGWSADGQAHELESAAGSTPSAVGAAAGATLATVNPAGGGTAAWQAPPSAPPAVHVREDYAKGAFQTAQLTGTVPGAVSGLALGGDGQGDALVGFMQGSVGRSEVLGAFVQAPPAAFIVSTPVGWVRGGQANVSWESALDAVQGVRYSVYVDGRVRLTGIEGLSTHLSATALGDGTHDVQVLATDAAGQQTMSRVSELKVDANPPVVHVRLIDRRHGVRVKVRDAASGVDLSATRIAFGDGSVAAGKASASHRYRHAGIYMITAHVRDDVGNRSVVRLHVRVL